MLIDNAFNSFKIFCKRVQNERGYTKSDYGRKFENHACENFCNVYGIENQFSLLKDSSIK